MHKGGGRLGPLPPLDNKCGEMKDLGDLKGVKSNQGVRD